MKITINKATFNNKEVIESIIVDEKTVTLFWGGLLEINEAFKEYNNIITELKSNIEKAKEQLSNAPKDKVEVAVKGMYNFLQTWYSVWTKNMIALSWILASENITL